MPTRIIFAGSAQIEMVMKIASPREIPDSKAKALNPTKEVMRMMAGSEVMPRIPVRNQKEADCVSLLGDIRKPKARRTGRRKRQCRARYPALPMW